MRRLPQPELWVYLDGLAEKGITERVRLELPTQSAYNATAPFNGTLHFALRASVLGELGLGPSYYFKENFINAFNY